MCNTFLCDKNYRKTVAKSSHMSRTCHQPFADVRKHIARKFPRSAQCDKYATLIRPFRELIAINKTDQNSYERRETLARMSHNCCETLARISRDCRETVAQMSHDCRTVVRRSHECLTTVVRHSRECLTTVVRLSSI